MHAFSGIALLATLAAVAAQGHGGGGGGVIPCESSGGITRGCFPSCGEGSTANPGCKGVTGFNCNAGGGGGNDCPINTDVCCGYIDDITPTTDTTGDPWVTGLSGQRFFFNPKIQEEAWFAAVSDPQLQINLKLHKYESVSSEEKERGFYTGASIQFFDEDGFATQSLLVDVRDDGNFDFSCQDLASNAPSHCLGGGAVDVIVNGVRMLEGGEVQTGEGFTLAAANVISSCQGISDNQLRHQAQLQKNRELSALSFEDFLVDRSVRSPADCDRWITSAKHNFGGVYKAPGSKSTFRFATPRMVAVMEFDTHIPTDITTKPKTFRLDFFMSSYLPSAEGSEGFIGETDKIRYSAGMQPILSGKVLKGEDEQYRVDGPLGRDFEAKHL